ncbi:MAG: CHASE2 domain-containing protein [Verrucomicrobia bacterium]|nr:CHASE2 domain-containing protein [Verrucomicrobiota bacterium]
MPATKPARATLTRSSLVGAFICVLLSLLVAAVHQLAGVWDGWSYDLSFLFKEQMVPNDVTIIFVDDETYQDYAPYGATEKSFDRTYYARVLDHLTKLGAKQVMIDVWFDPHEAVPGASNLAESIRRNGSVFLVVEVDKAGRELEAEAQRTPLKLLVDAGARHGVSTLEKGGTSGAVRQYNHGDIQWPGFVWSAARAAGADIPQEPDNGLYLNYYGPPESFRHVSLSQATNQYQDPALFKDKYIFIGSLPRTIQWPQSIVDGYRGPAFSLFKPRTQYAGVEIVATSFANLMQGASLRRMERVRETSLLILTGVLFGAGLVWFRPWWAALVSVSLAISIGVISCVIVWRFHVWYAWTLTSGLQIPTALLWSLFTHTRALDRENRELEQTLSRTLQKVKETAATSKPSPAELGQPSDDQTPKVADHVLIKRIGKGGYGEVWLGRNAVGLYHAVKLVYRKDFEDDLPYEREFKGIQKFMPISRSHPGFVHVLHVGRNDQVGFFYYVMEAGDDEEGGAIIDPSRYSPMNLSYVIRKKGSLKAKDCALLGLALADALACLHKENLIHRDIKPSNIIYAHGKPKLADIGLVTNIETTLHDVSRLGTDGYIPPEGPGAPGGDLYSLGKVLYEACMGLDRRRFPELPTSVYESDESSEKLRINRIILRACEPRPEDRYGTADELAADLRSLLEEL